MKPSTDPRLRSAASQLVPVRSLTGYDRNARTHSPEQVAQLAAAIDRFGFTQPLLVDERDVVIAGHGRPASAAAAPTRTTEPVRIATCCVEALPGALASWQPDAVASAFPPRHPVEPILDRPHLLLPCYDVEDPCLSGLAPGRDHVAALLDLVADARPRRLLVQCTAGLSRSPAFALVAAVAAGRDPAEACASLRRAVPQASPNRLVLAWGDALLGLGEALQESAGSVFEFRRDALGAVGERTGLREMPPQSCGL